MARCKACKWEVISCAACKRKRNRASRAYRQRHADAGLCVQCSRPALADRTRCAVHDKLNNQLSARSHAKRRAAARMEQAA